MFVEGEDGGICGWGGYYRYVWACACYYRGFLAYFCLHVLVLSGRFFFNLFFSSNNFKYIILPDA